MFFILPLLFHSDSSEVSRFILTKIQVFLVFISTFKLFYRVNPLPMIVLPKIHFLLFILGFSGYSQLSINYQQNTHHKVDGCCLLRWIQGMFLQGLTKEAVEDDFEVSFKLYEE